MDSVCRVCLASDRTTYIVANTALEQTYDVITGDKLQRAGRPTALCCVCLSQLRRCRRFIDTARESNAALDRWYQNHADMKLSEQPLFMLTKKQLFQITCDSILESEVKQEAMESETARINEDNDGTLLKDDIKYEVTFDYVKSDPTPVSRDEKKDNTEKEDEHLIQMESKITDKSIWVPLTDGPGLEQQTPISVRQCPPNVDTTSTPQIQRNIFSYSQSTSIASTKQHLRKQSKIHISEKPYACDKCDYKTGKKSDLQRHSLTHSDEKPFVCDKCDYKTNKKSNFKNHLLKHGELTFTCDKCDYKSCLKTALQKHSIIHTDDKPFTCDQCDFKTRSKIRLKKHIMTHTGEKPFACDKCDFKSIEKTSLKKHLMSHTGEKPFACDKCDYRSNYISNLNHHLVTHNREKLFSCEKCNFKSSYKSSLKLHLRSHTGEKPFMCDKCDFRCSQASNLKQHLLTHTGQKLFACDMCDFKYCQKSSLHRHLKNHK